MRGLVRSSSFDVITCSTIHRCAWWLSSFTTVVRVVLFGIRVSTFLLAILSTFLSPTLVWQTSVSSGRSSHRDPDGRRWGITAVDCRAVAASTSWKFSTAKRPSYRVHHLRQIRLPLWRFSKMANQSSITVSTDYWTDWRLTFDQFDIETRQCDWLQIESD